MTLTELLYWAIIILLTAGALCLTIAGWRFKRNWCTLTSAAIVAMTLTSLAVPTPVAPSTVMLPLGVLAVVLAVVGGGPLAAVVLQLATRGSVRAGSHGGILIEAERGTSQPGAAVPRNTPPAEPREVLRGGLTIGILERLAVVGSIVAGFPAAIAVIVAIKSVGRFSELDAAEARERFIIGTFTSLIWACACAGIVVLAGS